MALVLLAFISSPLRKGMHIPHGFAGAKASGTVSRICSNGTTAVDGHGDQRTLGQMA